MFSPVVRQLEQSRHDLAPARGSRPPDAVWVVAGKPTATNELLVGTLRERGLQATRVPAVGLGRRVAAGDVVLGRLDVQPTLDAVEDGLAELAAIELRGARVLNRAESLLACHDKLETMARLARFGVPQPATAHVRDARSLPALAFPVVVKPRFGSWGKEIVVCESARQLSRCLGRLRARGWFAKQGALVQELVPPLGFDLRLVVAGGLVVGAIRRVAAPGEWRTNVALGARRESTAPSAEACSLALAAAAAVEADLVGVDLLPLADGRHVVLEVNGAVDFTREYSLGGRNIFDGVAGVIEELAGEHAGGAVALAE